MLSSLHYRPLLLVCLVFFASCKFELQPKENTVPEAVEADIDEVAAPEAEIPDTEEEKPLWTPYNDSAQVAENADHEKERMRYKFIQSKVLDKNLVFETLYGAVSQFPQSTYEEMKPLVLEPIEKRVSLSTGI